MGLRGVERSGEVMILQNYSSQFTKYFRVIKIEVYTLNMYLLYILTTVVQTLKLQTLKVYTLKQQNLKSQTLKLQTLKLQTLKIQTLKVYTYRVPRAEKTSSLNRTIFSTKGTSICRVVFAPLASLVSFLKNIFYFCWDV